MRVVCVEPDKTAYELEMPSTLEAMQKAVGGYIEAVYPWEDEAAIICNEEGKIAKLPANRALLDSNGDMYDIVCGTFLVVGLTEEDFGSLTDKQVEHYIDLFRNPEVFLNFVDGSLQSFQLSCICSGCLLSCFSSHNRIVNS